MKGIVFTGFIEFVEKELGGEFLDEMFRQVPLSTDGAYSNVGYYPHEEILQMLQYICTVRQVDASDLVTHFGSDLFDHLCGLFPHLIQGHHDTFHLVEHLDQTIHKNVKKIHPDAEVPEMTAIGGPGGNSLSLEYRSARPFMHIALGMLQGCIRHYQENIEVKMTDLSEGKGNHARFELIRHG